MFSIFLNSSKYLNTTLQKNIKHKMYDFFFILRYYNFTLFNIYIYKNKMVILFGRVDWGEASNYHNRSIPTI